MSEKNHLLLPQQVEEAMEAELESLFDMGNKVSKAILATIRSELEIVEGKPTRMRGADLLYVLGYAIVDIANRWAAWRDANEEADAKPNDPD